MNLPTETFGNVVVVHTPEELGRDQADDFQGFVTALSQQRVVVDLDNTESLDSEGLAALLEVQELMQGVGGNVKVATTNLSNRKILEMTRLDRQLEVFESVIDAVKSFR
jgi:anti-anti-sigma factor